MSLYGDQDTDAEGDWTTVQRRHRYRRSTGDESKVEEVPPSPELDFEPAGLVEKMRRTRFVQMRRRRANNQKYFKSNLSANEIYSSQSSLLDSSCDSFLTSPPARLSQSLQLTYANVKKHYGESREICDELKSSSGVSTAPSGMSPSAKTSFSSADGSCIGITDTSSEESSRMSPTMLCPSEDESDLLFSFSDLQASSPVPSPKKPSPAHFSLFLHFEKNPSTRPKLWSESKKPLEKCTKAKTREQCSSDCPFVHEVVVTENKRQDNSDIFGPISAATRNAYLQNVKKISAQLDNWRFSFPRSSYSYLDSFSRRKQPSYTRGSYTNKGLVDVDVAHPCTSTTPCLLDSMALVESRKRQNKCMMRFGQ